MTEQTKKSKAICNQGHLQEDHGDMHCWCGEVLRPIGPEEEYSDVFEVKIINIKSA